MLQTDGQVCVRVCLSPTSQTTITLSLACSCVLRKCVCCEVLVQATILLWREWAGQTVWHSWRLWLHRRHMMWPLSTHTHMHTPVTWSHTPYIAWYQNSLTKCSIYIPSHTHTHRRQSELYQTVCTVLIITQQLTQVISNLIMFSYKPDRINNVELRSNNKFIINKFFSNRPVHFNLKWPADTDMWSLWWYFMLIAGVGWWLTIGCSAGSHDIASSHLLVTWTHLWAVLIEFVGVAIQQCCGLTALHTVVCGCWASGGGGWIWGIKTKHLPFTRRWWTQRWHNIFTRWPDQGVW